ncbi:MAG: response regulator [Pseudomonas sp.]|uniref:response regulator n=1 Tax=Pseudomonas sp. TaxID=306 RepID=UPI0027339EDF|nr:response regulator [Pseudomonas sp.]MDP3846966.1 response regulator [Pseudomonas sp.]
MSKVSVLVVDDAPFIRDLIKKSLRNHFPGIHIDEAINGRKAQQLLGKQTFDLILCDWEMPELSGLELLSWCREQDNLKATPFVMVTSRGDKENVVQAIQAGVSDFIGKPFSSEQLISKVTKALSRSGKLASPGAAPAAKSTTANPFANDSLSALTGSKSPAPAAKPAATNPFANDSLSALTGAKSAPGAKAAATPSGRGQGQLRLPGGMLACVIKGLSLKDAVVLVKRSEPLPQILESAVLDLEQGEGGEVARLNGYLHAIAAFEQSADSEWLQVTFRFVDRDPQKLDYLSRLIARGTVQKHFVPGA